MREIKFRGKRDNGEWAYGSLCIRPDGSEEIVQIEDFPCLGGIMQKVAMHDEVDPETVGQYTGLKDKNGVEVYEGDILGGILECCYVGYCDRCKSFQVFNPLHECMACKGNFHWAELVYDAEIIQLGNIYENPELLND